MRIRKWGIWLVVLSVLGLQSPLYAGEENNKQIVENAFRAWEKGEGSPFSLLSENAIWTITGPTQSAGSYSIQALQRDIIEPFNARLQSPLEPTLINTYQDGDTVIILFEAKGTMINGETYKNSYAWFFTMEGKKVIKVTAVLDLNAFEYLMALDVKQ
ncbi:nuclear transport factor 2 family protein [Alteromonas macleodii]|tara:strand:+ start:9805 stop:10278 length:474 start_codon:yes stop_codon:yes gene_type:complete